MATMTIQSRRSQTSRYRFPLSSNTAGAPLPLIPRRTRSAPAVTPQAAIATLTVAAAQPIPTSAIADDSDSSSSTPSDASRSTIRTKRERGLRIAVSPSHDQPALSSSPPSRNAAEGIAWPSSSPPSQSRVVKGDENVPPSPPKPLLYTPGMLRLGTRSSPPTQIRLVADAAVQGGSSSSSSKSATVSGVEKPAPVIRKKSGQLVKPSLKTSKSSTRGSLTVVTIGSTSKSEPATPTCKAVHFDSQLEHVKLFLAEQKPAAVSRDGSPTDDTSGTESDFPSFIYGDKDDKRKLVMRVINMPSAINLESDVALEELSLSQDGASIVGRIRVRNIAYAKWIAVRFTFDSWQTTSEVTGKYMDSINSSFDRFTFTIKLSDLLARIEEKTLFLAVRYSIEGKEMWDNNDGRNYQACFSRVKPAENRRAKLSDDEGSSASDVADLRDKLEKVMEGKTRTGPAFIAQNTLNNNSNNGRRNSASVLDQAPPIFRTSSSFASRYDFNASFRQPWKPVNSPATHSRTMSYPAAASTPTSSIPWPQKGATNSQLVKPIAIPILGSPRDLDPDVFNPAPRAASEFEDTPFPLPTRQRPARNHQRGYFDLSMPSGVKRTPPGSPVGDRSPPRFYSFPPLDGARSTTVVSLDPFAAELSEDSAVSSPSITTPNSSASSSPTEPFLSLMMAGVKDTEPDTPSPSNYSQLIDKFCFFTGSNVLLDTTGAEITRTQSASDVEEFITGTSPHGRLDVPPTPTRSTSFDDIFSTHSGPPTPTNDRHHPGPAISGLTTPTYGMY